MTATNRRIKFLQLETGVRIGAQPELESDVDFFEHRHRVQYNLRDGSAGEDNCDGFLPGQGIVPDRALECAGFFHRGFVAD